MTPGRRAAAAVLLAALAGASQAGPSGAEMRTIFGYRIQLACVQQDVRYQESLPARVMAASEGFIGWEAVRQRPFARCLAERRFIDKALCDDITQVSLEGPRGDAVRAMNASLDRHEDQLHAADDVLYLEDDFHAAPDKFTCPASPPVHDKDRR